MSKFKIGKGFYPYEPSASHIPPDYRDGWNACFDASLIRITELEALSANLKQEAQIHAMEARGANATINEINQFISGGSGEPANWHGAQPVKDFVNALKAQLADAKQAARWESDLASQALADLAPYRKDAERYQWLRDRLQIRYEAPMNGGPKGAILTMRIGFSFLDSNSDSLRRARL